MDNIKVTQGDLLARDLRFALIASRFNDSIVENLVRGAIDTLLRHGASEKQIEVIRVPGAFDLPLIARRAAASRRFDAVIALGAVIRGGVMAGLGLKLHPKKACTLRVFPVHLRQFFLARAGINLKQKVLVVRTHRTQPD